MLTDNRSIAFQDGIDKNENVKSVSFHQLVKMQPTLTNDAYSFIVIKQSETRARHFRVRNIKQNLTVEANTINLQIP